ncbi:MAG: RES domain-containing protein [Candidatus Rokuibacteriota bacterium]
MILYRHAPRGRPFLWETADQPPARWHGDNEGPAQYLVDTPTGAWAEFLRHEGITRVEELAGIDRAVWAIEVPDATVQAAAEPALPVAVTTGGLQTYDACRDEARRLRSHGIAVFRAPSAALVPGVARGWRVEVGLRQTMPRDGQVIVLVGARPDLVGWEVVESGRPGADVLERVRHLAVV